MKKKHSVLFGIAALLTVAMFTLAGCDTDTGGGGGDPSAPDPALTGVVSIGGTAWVGETLTANTGALGGSGTISYEWIRGTQVISGATAVSYALVDADLGKAIKVTVTRAGYTGSVSSGPTAAVTLGPIDAALAAIDASTHAGTADDPIPLIMSAAFDLGVMTDNDSNWRKFRAALGTKNKYVGLDLSACAMSGGTEFDSADDGFNKVSSLVLPDAALTMKTILWLTGWPGKVTVSGKNITVVPRLFYNSKADVADLTSVSFPSATTIGGAAFLNCRYLASVNIPAATTVGTTESRDVFRGVGTDSSVTEFTITIGANCEFYDGYDDGIDTEEPDDLKWGTEDAFKTIYDSGSVSGTAKAGGTYRYTKPNGPWTYTAP